MNTEHFDIVRLLFRFSFILMGLSGVSLPSYSQEACPIGKTCLFVSSSGNDSASGTETTPLQSLTRALNKANPGDLVLLKRGDTWTIAESGFKIHKPNITIDAYGSGSIPVLDGRFYYFPKSNGWSPYTPAIEIGSNGNDQSGAGATIRNIEIRESGGECIRAYSANTTLDNVNCNGAFGQGIQFREYAENSVLKNSRTYNHNFGAYGNRTATNLESARYGNNLDLINNRHGLTGNNRRKRLNCYAMYGSATELEACNGDGWGAGNFSRAVGTQFINNVVHGGWGESVIVGCGGRNALIDGLTIVDGKVGIYVDAGSGTIIRNNVIMGTGQDKYFRGSRTAGQGIGLNREPFCTGIAKKAGRLASAESVEIYNNVITGRKVGLFFWAELKTEFKNVKIHNNAFVNNEYALQFASGTHNGTSIKNNMFVDTGSDPKVKGLVNGFGSSKSGITLDNNYWSYKPEVASDFLAGTQTRSIVGEDITLARSSGYFNPKSDTYRDSSWVTPDWVATDSPALNGIGPDIDYTPADAVPLPPTNLHFSQLSIDQNGILRFKNKI